MAQHAGGEAAADLAQATGARGIVEHRPPFAVVEAEMDVDAVADDLRGDQRREARMAALPARHLAYHLTDHDGAVRARDPRSRAAGDLELRRAVLGHEDLGLGARLPQRRHGGRNEGLRQPEPLQRERVSRVLFQAGKVELVLEGRAHLQTGVRFQIGERRLEKAARAGVPAATIGFDEVALKEVERRRVVPEVDPRLRLRIRQQAEIPERTPGVGHQEAEGGEREVRRDPPDAAAEPALQVRDRHRARARHAGEVGDDQKNQVFALKPPSRQQPGRPPILSP